MTTIRKVQKYRLKGEEPYRVRLLLNEVCETVSPPDTPRDKRIAAYKPGWSDERVAEHFKTVEDEPFECSPKNVKHIRVNAFGSLYLRGQAQKEKKTAPGGLLGALTRIGMLKSEVTSLKEDVVSLNRQLNEIRQDIRDRIDWRSDEQEELKKRLHALEEAVTKPDSDIKTGAYQYKFTGGNGSL